MVPPTTTPPNSSSPVGRLQVSKTPIVKSSSPKAPPVSVSLTKQQQSAKSTPAEAGEGASMGGSSDRSGVVTGERGRGGGGAGDRRHSEDPRSREVCLDGWCDITFWDVLLLIWMS